MASTAQLAKALSQQPLWSPTSHRDARYPWSGSTSLMLWVGLGRWRGVFFDVFLGMVWRSKISSVEWICLIQCFWSGLFGPCWCPAVPVHFHVCLACVVNCLCVWLFGFLFAVLQFNPFGMGFWAVAQTNACIYSRFLFGVRLAFQLGLPNASPHKKRRFEEVNPPQPNPSSHFPNLPPPLQAPAHASALSICSAKDRATFSGSPSWDSVTKPQEALCGVPRFNFL